MFNADLNNRWITTSEVICLAELALRWPYHCIYKLVYELCPNGTGDLPLYQKVDEASTTKGTKFHLLRPVFTFIKLEVLIENIANLFVLVESVKNIEEKHPEYSATKPISSEEDTIEVATEKNIREILVHTLFALNSINWGRKEWKDKLYAISRGGQDDFISKAFACPQELINKAPQNIFPPFRLEFEEKRLLTTFEQAKAFLKLCSISEKSELDTILALIEVEKRFKGLTYKDLAELFPTKSKTVEESSREKHIYRLKTKAYKYANIVFESPVH